jgi:hypothetical protein
MNWYITVFFKHLRLPVYKYDPNMTQSVENYKKTSINNSCTISFFVIIHGKTETRNDKRYQLLPKTFLSFIPFSIKTYIFLFGNDWWKDGFQIVLEILWYAFAKTHALVDSCLILYRYWRNLEMSLSKYKYNHWDNNFITLARLQKH